MCSMLVVWSLPPLPILPLCMAPSVRQYGLVNSPRSDVGLPLSPKPTMRTEREQGRSQQPNRQTHKVCCSLFRPAWSMRTCTPFTILVRPGCLTQPKRQARGETPLTPRRTTGATCSSFPSMLAGLSFPVHSHSPLPFLPPVSVRPPPTPPRPRTRPPRPGWPVPWPARPRRGTPGRHPGGGQPPGAAGPSWWPVGKAKTSPPPPSSPKLGKPQGEN